MMKTLTLVILAIRFRKVTGEPLVDEPAAMERPGIFTHHGNLQPCHENAKIAMWCDEHLDPANLECRMLPDFDMYGCSCVGDASLCPTECIGDNGASKIPTERTHYGISCAGIPQDEPNYILQEDKVYSTFHRPLNRCENNALVAAWCDDYINPHLECSMDVKQDMYQCHCSGKIANCPTECIDGSTATPLEQPLHVIRCKGIPLDQPNYIIKEE